MNEDATDRARVATRLAAFPQEYEREDRTERRTERCGLLRAEEHARAVGDLDVRRCDDEREGSRPEPRRARDHRPSAALFERDRAGRDHRSAAALLERHV